MGVSDPEGVHISGRTFTATALCNVLLKNAKVPDLILHRSSTAICEYNNPHLLPGMFPTLFPLGIGGFDDPDCLPKISFQKQAEYYLDISDRSFRYHQSFLFVVLYIYQHRQAHLHTYLTVRKSLFNSIAEKITQLSPQLINSVANHLEQEGKYSELTSEGKQVLDMLKQVNTIASHIPGSQSSKILIRNEIRSYIGYFGIPHLYITINPSPCYDLNINSDLQTPIHLTPLQDLMPSPPLMQPCTNTFPIFGSDPTPCYILPFIFPL